MTAGQVSDYTGAAALLDGLPKTDWLLGDRGYDADWFRDALEEKGITPCIPGRKSRTKPVKYDKRRYKSRNRIEIMFGRLKDWRRVATRYDRCPTVFLSAVALAATVLFWLWVLSLIPVQFSGTTSILDHCSFAWNRLTDQPWRIMSIGLRQ
jgi:transposase